MERLPFRIGHGYDVHRLVENRKLILGGVEIPYERDCWGTLMQTCCSMRFPMLCWGRWHWGHRQAFPRYRSCLCRC